MQPHLDWVVAVDGGPDTSVVRFGRWLDRCSDGIHRVHPVPATDMVTAADAVALPPELPTGRADGVLVDRPRPGGPPALCRVANEIPQRAGIPVGIVPADLEPEALSRGPIAIVVAPDQRGLKAVRFGLWLALTLERRIVLVLVRRRSACADLVAWLDRHELAHLPVREAAQTTPAGVVEAAATDEPSMIVCGCAPTPVWVSTADPAGGLATAARVPVFAVPPTHALVQPIARG